MARVRFPAEYVYSAGPTDLAPMRARSGITLPIYLTYNAAVAQDATQLADIIGIDGGTIPGSLLPVTSGRYVDFDGPETGEDVLFTNVGGAVSRLYGATSAASVLPESTEVGQVLTVTSLSPLVLTWVTTEFA